MKQHMCEILMTFMCFYCIEKSPFRNITLDKFTKKKPLKKTEGKLFRFFVAINSHKKIYEKQFYFLL